MAADKPAEPRRTYNLPRGDASTTLRQFAGLLGRQVLFLSDKVRGEQTNALAGDYTPREALDRMLANTNLVAIEDEASGGFVVSRRPAPVPPAEVGQDKPQPKSEPMNPSKPLGKLRTLLAHLALAATTAATAQQTQEKPATNPVDEVVELSAFTVTTTGDAGYGSLMNTSGRLAKAYQDVPQMANVVTSELMRDMKRFDTFSALTYVPGVNVQTQTFQALNLRGFASSSRFVDGFSVPTALPYGTANDSAFADRIEVVKGPAPGSFGRGDPAGFINYVIKDPTFRRSTDVDVMVGTGNTETKTQRYMIDTNGLLSEDGKTGYRVVAVHATGANTPHFSEYEHDGVLLSLKRNFTGRGSLSVKALGTKDTLPGTSTLLLFVDQRYQDLFNLGLTQQGVTPVVFPIFKDRNTWLAYDNSHSGNRALTINATLDFKLGHHWSTRQAANFYQSHVDSDWLLNGSFRYAPDGVTALSTPLRALFLGSYRSSAYQGDFLGHYNIAAIDCTLELLAGGDYSHATKKTAQDFQFPAGQPIVTWDPYIPTPPWSINPDDKYSRRDAQLHAVAPWSGDRRRMVGAISS